MERYFPVPSDIEAGRRFVYGVGLVDLTITVLLLFNHFLQSSVPVLSGIALALNLSTHFYVWAATWILGSRMLSTSIVFFILAVYVVAFFVDIGATAARSFGPGGLFGWFTFFLGIIFIAIDLFQIVVSFVLAFRTKRFRQKMIKAVTAIMDSNVRANKLHKVTRWIYRFRGWMSLAWKFQLFFVGLTLFQFFLGLNFSLSFGLLILLEITHSFTWLWVWSVAGSPELYPFDSITDKSYLILYLLVFALTLTLSVTASVIRLVLLLTEIITPTIAPPLWRAILIGFGWFAFSVGIGLVIISGVEVFATYKINRKIDKHFERIQDWGEYIAAEIEKKLKELEDEEEEE